VTYTHDDMQDHLNNHSNYENGDDDDLGIEVLPSTGKQHPRRLIDDEEGWIDGVPTPGIGPDQRESEQKECRNTGIDENQGEEEENPMAIKLRKMRLELRG